ncbi:MBL fold metallo-hydrolase [Halostreptopolyspora alba]|uniref:MBL fold metallo-hydrolase n=1 Tax=Halostreptopolyspora alba TaxID=2487137 RepID=UPI0037168A04
MADWNLSETSRRSVLKAALVAGGATVAGGAASSAAPAFAQDDQPKGDRLVMLGIGGGPVVTMDQAKPALALVVNDSVYLVDCGLDTARQLVDAELGLAAVNDVFVTHQHLDHTSGLPGLVLHGWVANPPLSQLGVWGPPGTPRTVAGISTTFAEEIRLFSDGFGEFPEVRGHNVNLPKSGIERVMEDANIIVDATRVFHGPEVKNAYAYRITIKSTDKVVVFSGDTAAPDENLIEMARGCDVLVHETQDNDAIDKIASTLPPEQAETLRTHLLEAHSSVLDLPAVAAEAEAKMLVLSHYSPIVHPSETWLSLISPAVEDAGYQGTVRAPMDLDVIPL